MRINLWDAAKSGDLPAVEAIIASGANPNEADRDGATPLMRAALEGRSAVVHFLIEHGADPRATDPRGENAVYYAAYYGHSEVVAILHGLGVPPTLNSAALVDDIEAIASLVGQGADVNAKNAHGTTALLLAADRGNLAAARCLLELGADPGAADEFGTALSHAAHMGHVEVASFLLDLGFDINHMGEFGTPIIMASTAGELATVRLLLARGADVNAVNIHGYAALVDATGNGFRDVVAALLEHGADPFARNTLGVDAYTVARLSQDEGMVALFSPYVQGHAPSG
jgi:ankyrin repeat protein